MSSNTIKHTTHKAKEWVSEHKTAIIICGGIAVCIGVGVWGYKRFSIVEPALKPAVPKNAPIMTSMLEVSNVDSFCESSEIARESYRREFTRILHNGWHASQAKIAEAAEKGIALKEGETFVNSCTVSIKCA